MPPHLTKRPTLSVCGPFPEMHLTPKKGRTGLWFHGNQPDNTGFIAQRNPGRGTRFSPLEKRHYAIKMDSSLMNS